MREREREREREKRKGMERRASTSSQPSAPRVLESGSDFGGGGYAAQKKVHTIIREFFAARFAATRPRRDCVFTKCAWIRTMAMRMRLD